MSFHCWVFKETVCECTFLCVCAFQGGTSLQPSCRDNIINLYEPLTLPLRGENRRQTWHTIFTDSDTRVQAQVFSSAHVPWSATTLTPLTGDVNDSDYVVASVVLLGNLGSWRSLGSYYDTYHRIYRCKFYNMYVESAFACTRLFKKKKEEREVMPEKKKLQWKLSYGLNNVPLYGSAFL